MAAAASTTTTTIAIFIFSILFFSTFSDACIPCGQSPPPKPSPSPKPKPPPTPKPKSPPPTPKPKPPPTPKPKSPPPTPKPKSPPPTPKPKPPPTPVAPPPTSPTCPKDTLKLEACADLLGGVVGIVVGTPVSSKCCSLLTGLADLEAAVCLCTAIKANVLGINLNKQYSHFETKE
ncbi:hypothetical protein LguiA_032995 [Lonicera macranthoides]